VFFIRGFLVYTERIREKAGCDSWQGERMSLRKLVFGLMLVLPLGLCKAQSAPAKPVEPTAIGVVYLLDPTSQELKKLPDENWKAEAHSGFSTYVRSVAVKGAGSSFRIKANEDIEFVFKTGSPEKVSLYRFVQKGIKRYFDFSKGLAQPEPIKGLSVEVSQFGASSYKLVPASPLTPGEYAIIIAEEVYTFGVD
jgi:hypothetical protein